MRGWLKALDTATGEIVWNAYSTGPDSDVLIGPEFKPFYPSERGTDLGVTTWPPNAWEQGGGTVWGWLSYDPELNLLYYGTGNPGPWNAKQRPGDNKWTAGIFARDADTGAARWFYQTAPHDMHDCDAVNEQVLLDLTWNGAPRKVLVQPGRNGFVYVIDRTTGEVLSAEPFHYLTAISGVDLDHRQAADQPREDPAGEQGGARHLPHRARRKGLEALRLFAAHRPALHPAQQPVHGLGEHPGRATSPARPTSAPTSG